MTSLSMSENQPMEIKILQPKFDELYSEYQRKVEPQTVTQALMSQFQNRLRKMVIEEKLNPGVLIDTQRQLCVPLKERGITPADFQLTLTRLLKKYKYLDWYPDGRQEGGDVMLTLDGYDWAIGNDSSEQDKKEPLTTPTQKFGYFNIPKKASEKVQALLSEINQLPPSAIQEYPNLLSHQLRTIFALALLSYWDGKSTPLPKKKQKSLSDLIQYTINNAQEKKVARALNDIKKDKTKDLADDVVHCDYTRANEDVVSLFCRQIKNLLSLVYGR